MTQLKEPDVLQKLAQALDSTTDFLMMGSQNKVVSALLTDNEPFEAIQTGGFVKPEKQASG